MSSVSRRIEWIDGLKGIACLLVFVHHFLLALYPATYYGFEQESFSTKGIDTLFSYTPLGVLINGNFYVNVFILISAFLLCSQVLNAMSVEENRLRKIGLIALKRYPRLMLPTLGAGVVYYLIVYLCNAVGANFSGSELKHTFLGMVYTLVVKCWFVRDNTVIGNFWMLQPLFLGSFLAIFLGIIAGKNRRIYIVIPVYIVISLLLGILDHYMITIGLGCVLAYLNGRTSIVDALKANKKVAILLGVLMLVIGIYLGGYPSYQVPTACPTIWYRPFDFFYYRIPGVMEVIHGVGAFLLIGAFFLLESLDRLFSHKLFKWLGSISFGVFALHPIPLELWTYFFAGKIAKVVDERSVICLLTFVILLAIVLVMSQVFKLTVEKYSNKLVAKIK